MSILYCTYCPWTKLTADRQKVKNFGPTATLPTNPTIVKTRKKNQKPKYRVEYIVDINI